MKELSKKTPFNGNEWKLTFFYKIKNKINVE